MRLSRICAIALTLLAGASCTAPPTPPDFESAVPEARLAAIRQAVERGDASPETLRRLVEQLDCDDAAVRFAAIGALRRLTGETLAYRPDDPPAARREAVERWVAYVREREARDG